MLVNTSSPCLWRLVQNTNLMGCILDGADDDARHQSRPVAAAPSSSSMSPSLSLHHRRLARSAALNCLLLRDSRLVVVVPCWTRKKVLGVSPKSDKSSVDNVCRRNDVSDENEGATGLLSSPFGRVVNVRYSHHSPT